MMGVGTCRGICMRGGCELRGRRGGGERGTDRVLHRAQTDRLRRISWCALIVIVVERSMSIASRVIRARVSIDMVAWGVGRGAWTGRLAGSEDKSEVKVKVKMNDDDLKHGRRSASALQGKVESRISTPSTTGCAITWLNRKQQ